MQGGEYFRAGVGIVLLDRDGLVLSLERADVKDAWQLPQGGLERAETPVEAARRELWEETGVGWDQVEEVAEHPRWLAYELPAEARGPKTGRGQVHRWFVVRLRAPDVVLDLGRRDVDTGEPEFSRYRWTPFAVLVDGAVEFRRDVYEELDRFLRSSFVRAMLA